jgi:hypothetical protein
MDNYAKEMTTHFVNSITLEMESVVNDPPTKKDMIAYIQAWKSDLDNVKFILKHQEQ